MKMKTKRMDTAMTNEIIELLPSADLKAKIKETNHQFTEEELLQIIYSYAPTFDTKLEMLARFAKIAKPDVAALANVYVEHEKNNLAYFLQAEEGVVYELCIKEHPDACEEKYLCASYPAALVCIDRFYEEYADVNAKETEKSRYTITKRKIFAEGDIFDEDACAECVLGLNKVLLEVSDYKHHVDCDCEHECSECKELLPCRGVDISYPCFAHNYDIIKYSDYELKEHFGINVCLNDGKCDGKASEFYVIPLGSQNVREYRWEDFSDEHEHIELPRATLATLEDLNETERKNYDAFVAFWKSQKEE